ncbi:RIP metalloprotease RseP [Candidatus Parcubacteria bacterium]|jgi:regulator of sigma E protease|nr:MAG: RIP metalloprotease RseP [Candidatus Parcubacteria bacterium]
MLTILVFILILGLLIFVHELGHFLAARILGVAVEEFGFGFPPRLWGFRRKKTIYSLNWIPLGGFVRLKGENDQSQDPESFSAQKAWKRLVILVSGVTMNVVLAAVIFAFGFRLGLPSDISAGVPPGGKVRNPQVQIIEIRPDSPAAKFGMQVGDVLLKIGQTPIDSIAAAQRAAKVIGENSVSVEFSRSGQVLSGQVVLQNLPELNQPGLGVSLVHSGLVSFPWWQAIWQGCQTAIRALGMIVAAFAQIIKDLLFEQRVTVDVAGPVGIAMLTGQVARLGFIYLLQFAALLSLNLALINILPVPALDGGRVLFLLLEKIRGKPISQTLEAKIHNTGFVILLLLIMMVTFRDIWKLEVIKSLWSKIF